MSFVTSDRSIFHGNMSSLAPSSTNILLTQAVAFHTKKSNVLSRRSILRNVGKQIIPTSIRLFPQLRIGCVLKAKQRTLTVSASGTDVAVEEADLSSADSEASASATDAPEISGESAVASSTSSIKVKRSRTARKSDMPPVKNEELIPGATFTGKVRTIQPFGAFVDFGAFTDGLVHVSQLSDSYVKDVATVVTVGQEVTVRLVEANLETGRISLTMRSGEDTGKAQKQKESTGASDKSRPPRRTGQNSNQRRDETKKFSKFVKGQDLQGTVKNLTRAGAFISLPEGEEGFLPTSEESDEGFISMMGGSSFEVGQEVSVRVLRISRGQVTLTMKKDEAGGELDAKLNQGVVHTATNPFVLAFRTNQAIAAFLDEREKETKQEGKTAEEIAKDTDDTAASITDETSSTALDKEEDLGNIPEESETKDDEVKDIEEVQASSVLIGDDGNPPTEDQVTEESPLTEAKENSGDNVSAEVADISSEIVEDTKESVVDDATVEDELPGEPVSGELIDEASPDVKEEEKSDTVDNITTEDVEKNDTQDKEVTAVISSSESESSDGSSTETDSVVLEGESTEIPVENVSDTQDTKESVVDDAIIEDELPGEPVSGELTDEASPDVTEEETSKTADDITTEVEEKDDIQDKEVTAVISSSESESSDGSSAETDSVVLEAESTESPVVKNVNDNLGVDIAVNGVEKQTSADTQPNGNAATSNGQSSNASPKETAAKAVVSPALVKQLREETGAGMMDCKRALSETGGDLEKAYEYLRKKGLASADKKSSRATAEGRIGSYIHDSRIGVLIEVNCETDFVARGDIFKELVEDLAMQVAACPQVQYLTPDDVPQEFVDKEREIEMQKEDLQTKPEQFRSKIVDGRIRKRLEELALLEQPFIKDDKVVVKDWVKQTIATIGENIKVKRFVRYNLGEGLEKKSQDFAAEVAAQTAVKPVSKSVNQEPAVAETKETVNEPPKPVVSAALVKQLREETGAGMMDCKKALSETGGDLEKAHEYLRKKGLAAADKKSSRLAAEGRIGSYIHDSRIGVLIEVNCETDFVGRSENFKALVDDLAMQVVACPQVQSVSIEDVPENVVIKEKELEMQREDLQSKPENIREKIVEGRVTKRLGELALLEQPYIKNDTILVKDLVKQTVAALGENIKVRRFVRFTLGEAKDVEVEDQA